MMTREEFTQSSSDTQSNLELSEIAQLTDNGFPACGSTPAANSVSVGNRTPSVPLPCSRYRYSMSTTETRTFRSRPSRCCMGTAAVFLSLLTLGVFLGIMIHFTVIDVLWKDGSVIPKLPVPRADTSLGNTVPDFLGSVKIANKDWDYSLAVSDSLQYRDLAVRAEQELDRVFLLSPLKDIYNFSLVRTFRRGSIVAVFEIILTEHKSLSAEKVKNAMTQGLEHRKYIRGPDDVIELKQVVLDASSIQIIAISTTTVQAEMTTHQMSEVPALKVTETAQNQNSSTKETLNTPSPIGTSVVHTKKYSQTPLQISTVVQPRTSVGTSRLYPTIKPEVRTSRLYPTIKPELRTSTLYPTIKPEVRTSRLYPTIKPEVSTSVTPIPSFMWTPWRGTHFTSGPATKITFTTAGNGYQQTDTHPNKYDAAVIHSSHPPVVSTPKTKYADINEVSQIATTPNTWDSTTLPSKHPTIRSWESITHNVNMTSESSPVSRTLSTGEKPTPAASPGTSTRTHALEFDTDRPNDSILGLSRSPPHNTKTSYQNHPLSVSTTIHSTAHFQNDRRDQSTTQSNIPRRDYLFTTMTAKKNSQSKLYPTKEGEFENHISEWNTPMSSYPDQHDTTGKLQVGEAHITQDGEDFMPTTKQGIRIQYPTGFPLWTEPASPSDHHLNTRPHHSNGHGFAVTSHVPSHELPTTFGYDSKEEDSRQETQTNEWKEYESEHEPGEMSAHPDDYMYQTHPDEMYDYMQRYPNNADHVLSNDADTHGSTSDPETRSPWEEETEMELGQNNAQYDDRQLEDSRNSSVSNAYTNTDFESTMTSNSMYSTTEPVLQSTQLTRTQNTSQLNVTKTLQNGYGKIDTVTGEPSRSYVSDSSESNSSSVNVTSPVNNTRTFSPSTVQAVSQTNNHLLNETTFTSTISEQMFSAFSKVEQGSTFFPSTVHVLNTFPPSTLRTNNNNNAVAIEVQPTALLNSSETFPLSTLLTNSNNTAVAIEVQPTALLNSTEFMNTGPVPAEYRAKVRTSKTHGDVNDKSLKSFTTQNVSLEVKASQDTLKDINGSSVTQVLSAWPTVSSTVSSINSEMSSSAGSAPDLLHPSSIYNIKSESSTSAGSAPDLLHPSSVYMSSSDRSSSYLRDGKETSVTLFEASHINPTPDLEQSVRSTESYFTKQPTSPTDSLHSVSVTSTSPKVNETQSVPVITETTEEEERELLKERDNSPGHFRNKVAIPENTTTKREINEAKSFNDEPDRKDKDKNLLASSSEITSESISLSEQDNGHHSDITAASRDAIVTPFISKNSTTPLRQSTIMLESSTLNTGSSQYRTEILLTITTDDVVTSVSPQSILPTQDLHDLQTTDNLASTKVLYYTTVKSNLPSVTELADATLTGLPQSVTDFIDATSVTLQMTSSDFPKPVEAGSEGKEEEIANPYASSKDSTGSSSRFHNNACLDITIMTEFIPGCLTYFSQIMHTDDKLERCQHFLAGVICVTDEFYNYSGQQCSESDITAFVKQHAGLFNNALPNFDPLQCVI